MRWTLQVYGNSSYQVDLVTAAVSAKWNIGSHMIESWGYLWCGETNPGR